MCHEVETNVCEGVKNSEHEEGNDHDCEKVSEDEHEEVSVHEHEHEGEWVDEDNDNHGVVKVLEGGKDGLACVPFLLPDVHNILRVRNKVRVPSSFLRGRKLSGCGQVGRTIFQMIRLPVGRGHMAWFGSIVVVALRGCKMMRKIL